MPDTRPGSIFDGEGVCLACRNYEKRNNIDWDSRKKELDELCDKDRRNDGYYDCLIPVSGGKDSHRIVYEMKVLRNMNPLLITVGDPFTKTQAGLKNYRNLGETFNCDHILFELSVDLFKRVTRIAFEKFGEPLKFVEAAIYTVPMKIAIKLGIPLVVFGENAAYEYGSTAHESNSANEPVKHIFDSIDVGFWQENGIPIKEMNAIIPPANKELEATDPLIIYLSYYVPWSSTVNRGIAMRYGFSDLAHEWIREGYIENYEQIDSIAYIIHLWMKYPKFGFQRTSDIASRRVREGLLNLSEAKKVINEYNHMIDQRALEDFCKTLGYTKKEFWDIVDKFWNPDLFEKVDGFWRKRDDVFSENR
jgi:N-acetyl sugar amidotransferase